MFRLWLANYLHILAGVKSILQKQFCTHALAQHELPYQITNIILKQILACWIKILTFKEMHKRGEFNRGKNIMFKLNFSFIGKSNLHFLYTLCIEAKTIKMFQLNWTWTKWSKNLIEYRLRVCDISKKQIKLLTTHAPIKTKTHH